MCAPTIRALRPAVASRQTTRWSTIRIAIRVHLARRTWVCARVVRSIAPAAVHRGRAWVKRFQYPRYATVWTTTVTVSRTTECSTRTTAMRTATGTAIPRLRCRPAVRLQGMWPPQATVWTLARRRIRMGIRVLRSPPIRLIRVLVRSATTWTTTAMAASTRRLPTRVRRVMAAIWTRVRTV